MADQTISKTDFRTYLDCPLHFWALSHGRTPLQPPSAMDEFRMQQGQEVEALALEYLKQLMHSQYSSARLEWQRTILQDLFLVRADGLIYDEKENVYDLYEVKSGTSIDKEDLFDVAFQMKVCAGSLPLRSAYLVHLNKEYRRHGELDLAELFLCEDVTQPVAELEAATEQHMLAARQALLQETPENIEHCRKPDDCPFPDLCHPDLPEHSIYEISRLHRDKAILLEGMGVRAVQDIPADFKLSDKQLDFVQVVKSGQPRIERAAIAEKLAELRYPLHFLDYETCNPAIPLFEGYKPNQHLVFQYSLHILPAPDAEPEHHQFLHTECSDPAPALLEKLSHCLQPQGSIIVWNKGFECSRNREIAEVHPAYAAFLENVNSRIFDLMDIFSQNLYIHPAFHGSASIKKVLPVLVPELSYDSMEIAKGDEASTAWWQMVNGKVSEEEKNVIIAHLLKYCQLDTKAMLEIYRSLDF
ncbi:MAG: DUF2779 domain-containing protein [Anaerolineaceae bacterium]|jgi:CRISPR/Cas system-associated exonuclease Cas4 (RecB family)|nr:MAG: DUF2779 domain-containing protein [Anaerolineaceae bacterium]